MMQLLPFSYPKVESVTLKMFLNPSFKRFIKAQKVMLVYMDEQTNYVYLIPITRCHNFLQGS